MSNYPDSDSGLDDMRLIWKNSYLYNDPESKINQDVAKLVHYMEFLVEEHFGVEFSQKSSGKHAHLHQYFPQHLVVVITRTLIALLKKNPTVLLLTRKILKTMLSNREQW